MPQIKVELPMLDERPGPAARIPEARARRIVNDAVDRGLSRPGWFRARTYAKWPIGLAATLIVAAAAAGVITTLARRQSAPAPTNAPVAHEPAVTPRPIPVAPSTAPEAPPPDTAAIAPGPARRESAQTQPQPADLLRQANDLRADRRWRDAARAYERVLAIHPRSPEAYAASVAAGDLRLEQLNDPRGALRLYRTALQKNGQGALAEQVLWGIAHCQRAIGDADAEQRALQDYLARFPNGLFAAPAQKRLADLRPATP
jgi:tetratricopeptide (TPR) repeat protein